MNAGIPLSRALDVACAPASVSEKVKQGGSLSGSLDPAFFPPPVIAMIKVGETTGNLATGITRACNYMEKRGSLGKKLIGSLIYPAFVLILCVAALAVLSLVLIPSFAGIFGSMGQSLPPLSRFIMGISGYMPLIAALLAVSLYFAAKYLMSDRGLNALLIGRFRGKCIQASLFKAMAESLSSGMNLIDSLGLASGVVNSGIYRDKLSAISLSVTQGQALSGAFADSMLFDDAVLSLVAAGEQASSLDKVFGQLAALYEEEIDSDLKTFSSLVEPAATLTTGVVVGIIVLAMFMPVIKLINVLGG